MTGSPTDPVVGAKTTAGDAGAPTSVGADVETPRRRALRLLRKALPTVLSLVVVVGVFYYFLPKFASVSEIWASMQAMTAVQLGILAAAAIWNLASYWFVMVATMPGLRYPQAAVVATSTTAVSNTLPGGAAVGIGMSFAMFRSWGFSNSRISVALLVSGIFNNFAKLGLPVLALALLALQGSPSGGRVLAAVIGLAALVAAVVIFALLLRSERTARRMGLVFGRVASAALKLVRRPPVHGWELATVKFRDRTRLLLRARWIWITLATLVSHASLYLVLLLSLRFMGVSEADVGWAEVLAVFAFARLVTAIPITPGGLGLVEVALSTGLAAAGGQRAQVAAAVLIFRALTYVLPIPIGVLTYLFWRRNRSWRREPGKAPRTDLVPEHA